MPPRTKTLMSPGSLGPSSCPLLYLSWNLNYSEQMDFHVPIQKGFGCGFCYHGAEAWALSTQRGEKWTLDRFLIKGKCNLRGLPQLSALRPLTLETDWLTRLSVHWAPLFAPLGSRVACDAVCSWERRVHTLYQSHSGPALHLPVTVEDSLARARTRLPSLKWLTP